MSKIIDVINGLENLLPLKPASVDVVENIGIDGIVIWQDGAGKIYESSPNKPAKQIANSLAEYLKTK